MSLSKSTLNVQLHHDRKIFRRYSFAKLAKIMLAQRPEEVSRASAKAIAVWLNRIELGKMDNGPTLDERRWIANALHPASTTQREFYKRLAYVPQVSSVSNSSPLFDWLDMLPSGVVVSGDYSSYPLASYDPLALAMWYVLLVERSGSLRLFMRESESNVRHVINAATRLMGLMSLMQHEQLPETASMENKCRVIASLVQRSLLLEDGGAYQLSQDWASQVLSRISVYGHALPDYRFNPMTWFLAHRDGFLQAGSTWGNDVAVRLPDPAELQRHFALLDFVRRTTVTVEQVKATAAHRGLQLAFT